VYDRARLAAPDCPTCGALLRPIVPWQPPYQLQGWRCFACRGKQTTRPGVGRVVGKSGAVWGAS